jgi:hypothetical protein
MHAPCTTIAAGATVTSVAARPARPRRDRAVLGDERGVVQVDAERAAAGATTRAAAAAFASAATAAAATAGAVDDEIPRLAAAATATTTTIPGCAVASTGSALPDPDRRREGRGIVTAGA